MSTLQKFNTAGTPALQARIDEKWMEVQRWVKDSANFQHASLACQVMAGFTLSELREFYAQPGKRTDLTSPNDSARLGFQELCRKHCGISDDTARNWMKMAEGVKSLWKKLPAREKLKALMSVPPSQWTEDDSKLIADATHKVTDGKSQMEFMWELGCAKKPSGNPNAGEHGKGSRKLTLAEQAEAEKLHVADIMNRIMVDLDSLAGRFAVCTDMECEVFDGVLMKHSKAIKAWLAMPKNHRQPAVIAALFKR